MDSLEAIHVDLRRIIQQQTAILDTLKLTYQDTIDHQKEVVRLLAAILEKYPPRSTVVGAPSVEHGPRHPRAT